MITKFDIECECDRQLFNDYLGHMNGFFYALKLHWLLQILINALGSLIWMLLEPYCVGSALKRMASSLRRCLPALNK